MSYIAVHEAGHYLGLAHSSDISAMMFESYDPDTQSSPALAPDDIDGICKLYPPKDKLDCSEPGYVQAWLNEQGAKKQLKSPSKTRRKPSPDAALGSSDNAGTPFGLRRWYGFSGLGLV